MYRVLKLKQQKSSTQVRVQCDFIHGSDAGGCVVTLVAIEELDNTTVNLTREGDTA